MWAVVGSRGLRLREASPYPFLLRFQFSTTSTTASDAAEDGDSKNKSPEFVVDYLINSIGLSKDKAILASSKVSHFKSIKNPDLVIHLLKHVGGLDDTQLKDVVFSVPKVLRHRPDETLESKIRVLRDLGITGSHLVRLIKNNSSIFGRRLDTSIIPTISYLRNVFGGCDDKIVKALSSSPHIISTKPSKVIAPNIDLLRNYGVSQENIEKILIRKPRLLMNEPERLRDLLHRIKVELGIPCGSDAFFQAIYTLSGLSSSTLENKFCVFRSFGWLDSNILFLARNMPTTLGKSESSIRCKLHFFMKELGCTPAHLASDPALLNYSFEKRVKPRHEVLKILKGRKLVKSNLTLSRVLSVAEVKFVENFVLPYKDEVPGLYETYANNMKQQSKAQ